MSGDQQVFQNAMNQGHSSAWDQDWEKASSYYHIAIDIDPENINALTSLALALFELQKYPEALEYYQRVAHLSTNDPMPIQKVAEIYEHLGDLVNATKSYMDLAETYIHNKDVDKAIQSWLRVVALNPDHLVAHTRLALVYERLGRTSEAMVEYIAIASLLQSQGNIPKAVQTLKHALQVVPNSKEANQALTMLLNGKPLPRPSRPQGDTGPFIMSQDRPAETPKNIEAVHPRLDPIQDAKQKALTMLAELLFEQEEAQGPQSRIGMSSIIKGKGDQGQEQFDQIKIILHLSQAIDLQSHGDDEQAAKELERAMNAGLENSAAYFDLGFLQSKNEQLEKAIQNLKKSIQHELFGLGAHLLLALTLYKVDSIKEASIEYLEALRIADAQSVSADQAEELYQLYEPLIESYIQQSDEKLQKRICENISKMLIRPDWRDQTQLARQQLPTQPSGSTPVPLAEMLTEATSSQLVESLAKVNQLARANKLLSAMEEAYYALKFAPTYLPLHICIGDLLIQENRVPDAVLKYSIVAKSYNIRGETNRAISLLKRVSELAPMNLEARNNLIDLLMERGKTSDTLQEILKLAETYYSLADLAMARKTYSRAFSFSQQSNIDRDIKVKILHHMADIDVQSLDWRNAIRVFEQIKVLDPDDNKARDMLFDLNLRLGQPNQAMSELDNYLNHLISLQRSAEALEYINAKILENQNQPTLYRRLADVYHLLGRKEEAINQLEIAKEMFIQSGNRSAAIETITAILALNPTNASTYQRMLVELQAEK
jgi:tetratricopeptide (TPR) repeat protein